MQTTSRGLRIHYTVDGDGPPLVLVPGTLLAARHWKDFGYVDTLARDWRVIAIDPLGHGASDRPQEPDAYRPASVTADLVAVLDAEGVRRATVWGYSRGGWLAVNLAARYPQRVERLVVGAYAMHAHEEEVDRILVRFAAMLRDGDWARVWEAFGITDPAVRTMLEDGNDARAVAAAVTGSMCPTRYVDPASIACSATYYVGSQEWIVPHVRADVAALGAHGATLDVIVDQTHFGVFLDAAEPVLAAVTARLRE
ncbi:alpha/beta fold hydrolase [Mycolicibacterium psychrotolerans]|uniref:alpha/beta fold hydrolase n=1 Tax=Mycolicibacterium psychrotolerans TaxID=216929 RepID=UPI0013D73B14|nr:alpha/beta hydrolase [Mycolicibacterium psychrotolerans]